jgi:aspartate aminotransferase
MFETGIELKKKYGAENVYDFSLGNPDLPPPPAIKEAISSLHEKSEQPLAFGYVPNAGLPSIRTKMAKQLSIEQNSNLTAKELIITCGAAGALNIFFRSILEIGDEVICPAPYFVEYGFYVGNYGGILCPVKTIAPDFHLDLAAIEKAITPKTRAIIVNSPNNPSGQICSQDELEKLAALLKNASKKYGKPIFLISDEPYRFLTYDNETVPPILPLYKYSLIAGSFSKSHSLAGVRIGYIAVNPEMPGAENLLSGLILANRILGFVNAPVIGQFLLEQLLDKSGVDISIYDERRHAMAKVLTDAGIEFAMPKGAFYFFPKTPGNGDDKAFVSALQKKNILAVPGSGFGYPGYFRLTFCMDKQIILNSAAAFKCAVKEWLE